jgi:hypothetical protein
MARAPLDCPGSWRPAHGLQPGDELVCHYCDRRVQVTPPPLNVGRDPWSGSKAARVQRHWPSELIGKRDAAPPEPEAG